MIVWCGCGGKRLSVLLVYLFVLLLSGSARACDLVPIGVSKARVAEGVWHGKDLGDIFEGTQPGNFGWLTWSGSPSVDTLEKSLIPPGTSADYVNPHDPSDNLISSGDWICGRPGVGNSKKIRAALGGLETAEMVLPIWDQTAGQGANTTYRVWAFARFRLLDFDLPKKRIRVEFLWYEGCGEVNDAPQVSAGGDRTIVTGEVAALEGVVSDDGRPVWGVLAVEWSKVSGPGEVTFSGSSSPVVEAEFSAAGEYVLRLAAFDGEVSSHDDVTVTVNDPNRIPVAENFEITVPEDQVASLTLGGSDPDGDALDFRIVDQPAYGTLAGSPPNLTYTPITDYHGPDRFYFAVNDGQLESEPAEVSIAVEAVNDAPVADAAEIGTPEDTPVEVTLTGADVDADPLSFRITRPPEHGTLSGEFPDATYTPSTDYFGEDEFEFVADDGVLDSEPATVTVTIEPVNDVPVAESVSLITDEDTALNVTLSVFDPDGDSLAFELLSLPESGTLAGTPPNLSYTPLPNANGPDEFRFKVSDGNGGESVGTVGVSVLAVNDAPTAFPQSFVVEEDGRLDVLLAGFDVDGDPLTFSVAVQPKHGSLVGSGAQIAYLPADDYHGADSFEYRVSDGKGGMASAVIAISVIPVNDPPSADGIAYSTDEDTAVAVTLAGADADGDVLAYAIDRQPDHGSLAPVGESPSVFLYKPASNYSGTDSFTYTVSDSAGETATGSVTVTINPVNDPPVAVSQTVMVDSGESVQILLSATDPEGDAVTFEVIELPAEGTLSGEPPTFTYTSEFGDSGTQVLQFVARDAEAASEPATVTIDVRYLAKSRTWTSTADFQEGAIEQLRTDIPGELRTLTEPASIDFVWIPLFDKGTIVRIDPESGQVLGEYRTAPDSIASPYPSRTTIDGEGNLWVANQGDNTVTLIAAPTGTRWVDRNGNGVLDTSIGIGDVRPWTDTSTGDPAATAEDELIISYTRVNSRTPQHLSATADGYVWVGGSKERIWDKISRASGQIVRTEASVGRGGYGGIIDPDGVIWSTGRFLRWDTSQPLSSVPEDEWNLQPDGWWGVDRDSKGNIWVSRDSHDFVYKYSANGDLLGQFEHGSRYAQGIVVDQNDHVWVAHSHCGSTVGHLLPDGTLVGKVPVIFHGPTAVDVDRKGRIWVSGAGGVVQRINPLGGRIGSDGVTPVGGVDLNTAYLGGTAWTYSDFTGGVSTRVGMRGNWTATFDSELPGARWGPVRWNGLVCSGAEINVWAATSDDGETFTEFEELSYDNSGPITRGRHIRIRVQLDPKAGPVSPVLHDITVGTIHYEEPLLSSEWIVTTGDDFDALWPGPISLPGAICRPPGLSQAAAQSTWSVVSGPGDVRFADASAPDTVAEFSSEGDYVLRLTATLGGEVKSSDLRISLAPYNKSPWVTAGEDAFLPEGVHTTTLAGEVRDDGLPKGTPLAVEWTKKFGPGDVSFDDPSDPGSAVTFSEDGIYILELSANDSEYVFTSTVEYRIGAICSVEPPTGLVSWWQLNGDGADHVSGNQIFFEGGPEFTEGHVSAGLDFDGQNDRAHIFGSPTLEMRNASGLTVEFWARVDTELGDRVLLGWHDGTRGVEIEQVDAPYSGIDLVAHLFDEEGMDHPVAFAGGLTTKNEWRHFAVTYDRSRGVARVYRNGRLFVEQQLGSFRLKTSGDLFLGSRDGSGAYFKGGLDEVSLYNRALDGSEIWSIYEAGQIGKCTMDDNEAPLVDAGPDLYVAAAGGSASLSGTVFDDGLPSGAGLRTLWKLVDGPGTVTFEDPSLASTSATFEAAGLYLLALEAEDGASGSQDRIEVRVGSPCETTSTVGLVGWWPGNGLPVDVVDRNDALLMGGMAYTEAVVSQGFEFDGSRANARIPASAALDVGAGNGLTVEFWARVDSEFQNRILLGWHDGTSGIEIEQQDGSYSAVHMVAHLYDTGGVDHPVFFENGFSTRNVWQHFAITYDRTSGYARIYRDGALHAERNIGSIRLKTTGSIWLGSRMGTEAFFDGGLDELSIYDRALDGSEIWEIYRAASLGKCPPDENQPPVVDAGPDLFVPVEGEDITLAGEVTDDGLPAAVGVRSRWKVIAGPGAVSITEADAPQTTANFAVAGLYLLELEAEDGAAISRDQIEVRVGMPGKSSFAEGIVGWWPGNGLPVDVVGGNDALLSSGAGYVDAKVSQGFEFDGGRASARIPASTALDLGAGEGMTVEFWSRVDSELQDRLLLGWNDGTSGVEIEQKDGSYSAIHMVVHLYDSGGADHPVVFDNGLTTRNVWRHFAITYERATGEARIYGDGALQVVQDVGTFELKTRGDLFLGSRRGTEAFLDGGLDEVALYNRALDASEIWEIYASNEAGKVPFGGNLPPVVDAGPDLHVAVVGQAISLRGNVFDDGMPTGAGVRSTWKVVSGPGTVTFGDASTAETTGSFSEEGIYVLALEAEDGAALSTDWIEVRVGPPCEVAVPKGLVGWWPGNGTPVDLVYGNAARLSGGADYTDAKVALGFDFDGVRASVRVRSAPVLDIGKGSGMSVEFWARADAFDGEGVLLGWNDATTGVEIAQVYEGYNHRHFVFRAEGVDGVAHDVSFSDGLGALGVWQHFAVTYDKESGLARIYRDGVLRAEQSIGTFELKTTGDLFFGSRSGTSEYFKGGLDEVGLYDRELDASEVWAIYAMGAVGKCPLDGNDAPIVDAGPDLYVHATGEPVALAGSVSDDGLPAGSVVRSAWKKVSGPGAVLFGDASAPATTASFEEEGLYLLSLEADDGASLRHDLIEARVGSLCQASVDVGLVGWWPGNGTGDDLVSGYSALSGGGADYAEGRVSLAFGFNGSGATTRVPAAEVLDVGKGAGFSLEFWARPDAYYGSGVMLGWNDGTAGVEIEQVYGGYNYRHFVVNLVETDGTHHSLSFQNGLGSLDVWQHFAVTYDRSTGVARIFRDGAVKLEQYVGSVELKTTGDLYFGSRRGLAAYFSGGLDEVSLYDRALTDDEIASIHSVGACGKAPVNAAPEVDAGPDRAVALPASIKLVGSVRDDGYPLGSTVALAWSVLSGPDTVVFSPQDEATTEATFSTAGTYVLQFSADDGQFVSTDTVTIVARPEPIPPTVSITSPSNGQNYDAPASIAFVVSANDADGAIAAVEFFRNGVRVGVDAETPYEFVSAPLAAGNYSYYAVATDDTGLTATSEEVEIVVDAVAPQVTITSPTEGQRLPLGRAVTVSATASDADGSVAQVEFFLDGIAVGVDTAAPYSLNLDDLDAGTFSVTAVATGDDGLTAASSTVTFEVVDLGGGGQPILEIISPANGEVVTSPAAVIGIASGNSLDSYTLQYRRADPRCPKWVTFATGSGPVLEDALGTFDTTLLINGIYEIRLLGHLVDGSLLATQVTVVVEGGMKVGHFTLAFDDLTIPLAGIPITVRRTYDSRDRCPGDFGHGWNLDLESIRLQTSSPMGDDWEYFVHEGSQSEASYYRIDDAGPHIATVCMPGGETLRFRPKVVLRRSPDTIGSIVDADGDVIGLSFSPISYAMPLELVYRATGGTRGATLAAKGYRARDPWFGTTVEVAPDSAFYVEYPQQGPIGLATHENSAQDAPLLVEATGWILTSKEGRVFEFDAGGKLIGMTDGEGNTLVMDRDNEGRISAVTHSSGESIVFHRDTQGRIDSITDPRGNVLHYVYASNGDLDCTWERVTPFPGPPTVRYYYKGETHLLDRIVDARGKQAVRNEYDEAGRLVRKIDADGQETVFTHNIAGRTETIRDPDGYTTFHRYDERGNVVETILPDNTRTVTDYHVWSDGTLSDLKTSESVTGLFSDGNGGLVTKTLTTTYRYEDDDPATLPENDGLLRKLSDPMGHDSRFRYDALGNVLMITDEVGNTTTNSYYPGTNLLHTTTDALGHVTTFTYDAQGNLDTEVRTVTASDGGGAAEVRTLVTDYDYDAAGRLVRTMDPVGHVTTYEYDANGNRTLERTTRTDEEGSVHEVVTEFEYDANDRLTKTWDAGNPRGVGTTPSSEIVYNEIGKPWKTYDALRRVTERLYSDRGELSQTIYPDGSVEEMHYDASGRPEFGIDRRGYATQLVYDSMGRVTETRFHGDNGVVTLSAKQYDASGRLWKSTDALGNTTTHIYDDAGRRVAVVNALGQRTGFGYDGTGNLRFVTDAKGQITKHIYDALNRRVRTIYPASEVWTGSGYQSIATQTEASYDELGRRVSTTDQSGKTTQFLYDDLGRLAGVEQPPADSGGSPTITRYTYDEAGNQLTQTDALGRVTRYSYNNLARRLTRTLPLGQTETAQYDEVGNMQFHTDFNGRTTEYRYDVMNRFRFRIPDSSFGEPAVEWTYTVSGRRATMTDASGTTTYFYDDRDRLESVERPEGTLDYSFDAANNLESISSATAGAAYMGYTYDALNRLATVTDANSEVIRYGYDANGNLGSVALPTGVTATYTYNAVNRLTALSHTKSLATVVADTYGLHPTGHRREVLEGTAPSVPERNVTYEYDDLWRLKSESIANDPNGKNGVANYFLDAVGNRQTRGSTIPDLASQTFGYDDNDQVLGDTTDDNGNTLQGTASQPPAFGTSGTDTYDSFDRLIRRVGSVIGQASTIAITYNGDGHKVRESVTTGGSTTTTTYLIDELNPTGYAQVLEEHTNGSPTRVYTYGHDLISMDQIDGSGASWNLTYYGYDGHGSVRFLTDDQGNVTDTYTYDAFGELLSSAGITENLYRYAGEEFDEALGLYYLRARFMNPRSGRFWTTDRYEGQRGDPASLHKYAYANADAVNGVDPSGFVTLSELNASNSIASSLRLGGLVATLQQGSVAYLQAEALGVNASLRSAALDAMLAGDFERADALLTWSYLVSASVSASESFNDVVQTAVATGGLAAFAATLPAAIRVAPKLIRWLRNLPKLLKRRTVPKGTVTQVEFEFVDNLAPGPQINWPPNDGFVTKGRATLIPGARLDRFGGDGGRFIAAEGTSFGKRSLPSGAQNSLYSVFEVVKPFEVDAGPAVPWFRQPGKGLQFQTDVPIRDLIENGYLRVIRREP